MSDHSTFPSLDAVRSQLRRPPSLTLLGWILIMQGLLAPLLLAVQGTWVPDPFVESQLPLWVHYLSAAVSAPICVTCGAGLLTGREWARFLWIGFWCAEIALDSLAFPGRPGILIAQVAWLVFWVWLLFRRAANDYFVAISSQNDPILR